MLTKNWFGGTFWATFFTSSSGHPAPVPNASAALEGPAGLEQGDTNMIRFKKDF
jgi:hypothetical protein